jgi:aryl-alcohol dehydrogenase-like predicted oxidoreductase
VTAETGGGVRSGGVRIGEVRIGEVGIGEVGPAGRIGLGCMGMSTMYYPGRRDDEAAVGVVRRALDLGANVMDTADVYGPFTNEALLGRALRGCRERAVVATKVGFVVDPVTGEPVRNGRPDHVRAAIDASLSRLGTDHVELWQLHRVDPRVPIEETWGAMAEAVTAGKVRALGLSEVTVAEIRRAAAVHPVATVQSELSLWTREAMHDVVPHCARTGIAFLAFCPLGRGFLTGGITTAQDLPDDDARHALPRFQPAAIAANQAIVAAVRSVARSNGCTPAQAALAWVLARGAHVVPLPGTTSRVHLDENVGAAGITLSDPEMSLLDAAPEAAGSRY